MSKFIKIYCSYNDACFCFAQDNKKVYPSSHSKLLIPTTTFFWAQLYHSLKSNLTSIFGLNTKS